MKRISQRYPEIRIDIPRTFGMESDEYEGRGADPLKNRVRAPSPKQELLVLYETLDEQRHLADAMIGLETNPELKRFLETMKRQLDAGYVTVGGLLKRRHLTH
jgi:hypothetical protein